MKLNNASDKTSVRDGLLQHNRQILPSKYIDEEENHLRVKNITSKQSSEKNKERRCYVIGLLCIIACFICTSTLFIIINYVSAGTF